MITKVKKIVDGSSLKVKANFKRFVNENHKILNSKDSKAINEKLNEFLSDNHIVHDNFEQVKLKNIIKKNGEVFAVLEKYRQENNRLFIEANKVFGNIAKSGVYHYNKINEAFSVLESKYSHLSRKINENSDLDLTVGTFSIDSLQELKDNFDSKFLDKNGFDEVRLNDFFYNGGVIDLTVSKNSGTISGYTATIVLNYTDTDNTDKDLQNMLNDMANHYFESAIIDYVAESINEADFSDDAYDIFGKAKKEMQPEDIDHHESDLYLKVNDISTRLVKEYAHPNNITKFRSQIDNEMWYEIPFAWYKESVNESDDHLDMATGIYKFKSFNEFKDRFPNIDSLEEITINSITEFFDNGGYLEIEIERNDSSKSGLTSSVEYTANPGYMIRNYDSNKLDALIKSNIENNISVNESDNLSLDTIKNIFPDLSDELVKKIDTEFQNADRKAGLIDRVSTWIAKELGYIDEQGEMTDEQGYKDIISKTFEIYKTAKPINESDNNIKGEATIMIKDGLSDAYISSKLYSMYNDRHSINDIDNIIEEIRNTLNTKPINEDSTEPKVITKLRKIVADSQYDKVRDTVTGKTQTVDMGTASLLIQVYDALNDEQKVDFVSKGLVGMTNNAYKMSRSINEDRDADYDKVQADYETKSKELFGYGNGWVQGFSTSVSKKYGDDKYIKVLTISVEVDFVRYISYFQVRVGYSKTPNYGEEANKYYAEEKTLSSTEFNTMVDAVAVADKFANDWNSKPINENDNATPYVEATELVKEKIKDWDGKGVLRFDLANPIEGDDKQLFLTTAGRDVQEKFGKPYQVTLDNISVMITNLDNINRKGNIINECVVGDSYKSQAISGIIDGTGTILNEENGKYTIGFKSNTSKATDGYDKTITVDKDKLKYYIKIDSVNESDDSQDYNGIKIHSKIDKSGGQETTVYKAPSISDKWWWDLDKLKSLIDNPSAVNEANDNSLGDISRGTIENAENGNYIVRDTSKPIDNQIVYDGDDRVTARGILNALNNPNSYDNSKPVNEDEDGYVTTKKDWESILQKIQQYNRKDGFVGDKDNKLTFFDSKPSFSVMYVTLEMVEDIINSWTEVNESKKYKPVNESSDEDYITEYTQKDDKFKYMLLDRMQSDNDYFLGNGRGYEGHLFMGDKIKQIKLMKALYDSLIEKPEWLSMEEIIDYATKMGVTESVDEGIVYADTEIQKKAVELMKPEDIDHHSSDLYLKINDISTKLVAEYDYPKNVTKFRSQIDNEMWYEIPFGYNDKGNNQPVNEDAEFDNKVKELADKKFNQWKSRSEFVLIDDMDEDTIDGVYDTFKQEAIKELTGKVNEDIDDQKLTNFYTVCAAITNNGYDLPQEILDEYLTDEFVESFLKGADEIMANSNSDNISNNTDKYISEQVNKIFPKNIILQYT